MAKYDDLNMPLISVVAFISIVLTFVSIVAAQIIYYAYERNEIYTKRTSLPDADADNQINQQIGRLNSYGWIDRQNKVLAIPIDQAMSLVLKEQGPST